MEHITYVMLSGLLVAVVSIAGLIILKSHRRMAHAIERNLETLSATSAGVFLVTSFLLIRETLEVLPIWNASIAFLSGGLLYLILHHVIAPHRHHGDHEGHRHRHNPRSAWKILIGDAIHNLADGLLLVASFGIGTHVGVTTTASIVLHELPQEVAEFFVLRKSGYSNTEATYRNVATAMSIFLGIGLGMVFINTEALQGYLLGMTATFFLGIVFTDLFPVGEVVKSKDWHRLLGALAIGVILMTTVSSLLGHDHHVEGHDEHDHLTEHQDH